MRFSRHIIILSLFLSQISFAQEGIPVYSDYLSDNLYLIHPSMAGAANCAKIRLTARKQWFGVDDAPALQTASFNGRIGEKSGAGIILFNDENGYHSQKGFKVSYAHHLLFSRDEIDLNQLSFGISAGLVQSQLDQSEFEGFDLIIDNALQKDSYFNVDIGASYNYLEFFSHFTVRNVLASRREIYTEVESDNLRKFLFSAGYVFGNTETVMVEPSVLFQYTDETKEKMLDLNLKFYKDVNFGKVWGGLSYRRSFDAAQFTDEGRVRTQRLQYITPIVGLNYKNLVFAYTYSHIVGNNKFDQGGFHQITLGINLFCKREKWDCNCPAIN